MKPNKNEISLENKKKLAEFRGLNVFKEDGVWLYNMPGKKGGYNLKFFFDPLCHFNIILEKLTLDQRYKFEDKYLEIVEDRLHDTLDETFISQINFVLKNKPLILNLICEVI